MNFYFIHIPKTAGESIEKTLGMSEGSPYENLNGTIENKIVLQHLTGEVSKKDYIKPEIWIDYFKFAVVRNPWSGSVSEYNWFLRYGTSVTFSEWVKSLETRIKINKSILGTPIFIDFKALLPKYCIPIIYTGKQRIN